MASGATFAIGLLGVEVREEDGDVAKVASLLGGLLGSSSKLLTWLDSSFSALLTPFTIKVGASGRLALSARFPGSCSYDHLYHHYTLHSAPAQSGH